MTRRLFVVLFIWSVAWVLSSETIDPTEPIIPTTAAESTKTTSGTSTMSVTPSSPAPYMPIIPTAKKPVSDTTQGMLRPVNRGTTTVSAFVLKHTDVKVEISGAVTSVEVEQEFINPNTTRIEAVYVFPLPENAAVTDMYLRVSSRVIVSEVHEKEKAKKIYEKARKSGRTAGLLEQERPNIFTQSVANILPGESVFVRIRYVSELKYDNGRYKFVFPLVVGHRFNPPGGVPDAARIMFPILKPGERNGHDISVRVALESGVALKKIHSKSHNTVVKRSGPTRAVITLSPSDTIPNKDFVLEFGLRGNRPEAALLAHRSTGDGHFMVLIQPQASFKTDQVTPKEMIFVVDCSGSMSGDPLTKAKEAMRRVIKGMNPDDSFQIIKFSEGSSALSPSPLANTPENVRRGLSYINGFRGVGGTHMLAGIEAALKAPIDPKRRRMVTFMTDGYIGNENQILAAIDAHLGDTRLFSFGVGSSVNRHLLELMAERGRGFAQFIRPDEETKTAVELFYKRIQNPLLMDIAIDWGGMAVQDVYPKVIPDLFDNQPIFIFGRYTRPSKGTVKITGTIAGRPYETSFKARLPEQRGKNRALGSIWARKQIKMRMDEMNAGEKPALVKEIVTLAKRFKLMSKYTSFVAVERSIRADVTIPITQVLIPNEMPEGVSYDGIFGPGAATVSLPRMKPGDPVLAVNAPGDTVAVIADFPFGKRMLCPFDAEIERWTCRFLVPRSVADGRYTIKILAVRKDGRRTRMDADYVVDSKAPVLRVEVSQEGSHLIFHAVPIKNVLVRAAGPDGRVEVRHDLKSLRVVSPDARIVTLKLLPKGDRFLWSGSLPQKDLKAGRNKFIIEAMDYAGNIHRQTLWITVKP